jgi:hypothetical protein
VACASPTTSDVSRTVSTVDEAGLFEARVRLSATSDFSANSCTAALAPEGLGVQVLTLNGSLPPTIVPTIAKVDGEGYERAVLEGRARTFGGLQILEDHDRYPSEITSELGRRGFASKSAFFGLSWRKSAWRHEIHGTPEAFWQCATRIAP